MLKVDETVAAEEHFDRFLLIWNTKDCYILTQSLGVSRHSRKLSKLTRRLLQNNFTALQKAARDPVIRVQRFTAFAVKHPVTAGATDLLLTSSIRTLDWQHPSVATVPPGPSDLAS